MKTRIISILPAILFACIIFLAPGCKKKETGVCYCKYLSGDKKEFNLTSLTRSQAIDSCYVLNGYAKAFAGDCKLK
jgi:hypothetical protein